MRLSVLGSASHSVKKPERRPVLLVYYFSALLVYYFSSTCRHDEDRLEELLVEDAEEEVGPGVQARACARTDAPLVDDLDRGKRPTSAAST